MKHFRQTKQRPKKSLLITGVQNILQALKTGEALERIYIQQNISETSFEQIKKLAFEVHVPINKVPIEKLHSFNIPIEDNCIAIKSKIQYHQLQDVITYVMEKGESPFFLILDGITDIRNIGGIARTAYCCGVQAIIIPDKGVGMLNEEAILTSAGALEKIFVCRVNSLMKAIDELHLNGIKVFATEMSANLSLKQINFVEPCAIVFGSEEKGIYPALTKICDSSFKIPMQKSFDSLNVSVATGIILYEAMMQRATPINNLFFIIN